MGMFDTWKILADTFPEGQVFELQDAKTTEIPTTAYGVQTAALLKIGDEWYSVFGSGIVAQVQRMDAGDLPARVSIQRRDTKAGNQVKLLVPEGKELTDDDIPF